jgi:hypothetical protein
MRRPARFALVLLAAGLLASPMATSPALGDAAAKKAAASGTVKIPDRPEKLEFPPLEFEAPDAAKFRHRLSFGSVAYVAEDHSLPLVEISLTLR